MLNDFEVIMLNINNGYHVRCERPRHASGLSTKGGPSASLNNNELAEVPTITIEEREALGDWDEDHPLRDQAEASVEEVKRQMRAAKMAKLGAHMDGREWDV